MFCPYAFCHIILSLFRRFVRIGFITLFVLSLYVFSLYVLSLYVLLSFVWSLYVLSLYRPWPSAIFKLSLGFYLIFDILKQALNAFQLSFYWKADRVDTRHFPTYFLFQVSDIIGRCSSCNKIAVLLLCWLFHPDRMLWACDTSLDSFQPRAQQKRCSRCILG
jgi:hypothetical protein